MAAFPYKANRKNLKSKEKQLKSDKVVQEP